MNAHVIISNIVHDACKLNMYCFLKHTSRLILIIYLYILLCNLKCVKYIFILSIAFVILNYFSYKNYKIQSYIEILLI